MNQKAEKTQKISELLEASGARAVAVLDGIGDEQLDRRTPCTEYDVRALVNHLFQVVVQFQALAAKKDADFSGSVDLFGAGSDWRERFAAEVRLLVDAWAAPGAEEGTTGQMGFPARTVGQMVLGDLTLHAWDLARATGLPYAPDEAVVADLAPAVAAIAPGAREAGVYGAPVEVPEDAPDFDVVLATTGRDPRWRP
ncbi:TIGR03086 family metal-binding protein [Streptomyces sp. NPDC004111]|uniref:TIGR03086 family metal-binding protein n=1 Tax=Streptomyces sp. NPDC004111 TaxID=3364690 RepID=UPI003673FC94